MRLHATRRLARLCATLLALALCLPPASLRTLAAPTDGYWYAPIMHGAETPIIRSVFDPQDPGAGLAITQPERLVRTRDGGLTWEDVVAWAPSQNALPWSLAYGQRPRTYYAFAGVTVRRTDDAGATWVPVPYNHACNTLSALVVAPTDPLLLLAQTSNGLARSADGGQTWRGYGTDSGSCIGGPAGAALAFSPTRASVAYASKQGNSGGGALRSDDGGASWQPINTGLPMQDATNIVAVVAFAIDPRDDNRVFAQTSTGQFFRSSNGGSQWQEVSAGLPPPPLGRVAYDASGGHRLLVAASDGIYTLADGADTWQALPTAPLPQPSSSPTIYGITITPAPTPRLLLTSPYASYLALPRPTIAAIEPTTARAGSGPLRMIVRGAGFGPTTTLHWGGRFVPTEVLDAEHLAATIRPADLLGAGVVAVQVAVPTDTPAPGGVRDGSASGTLPFTITDPRAAITSLEPDLVLAGAAGFTLAVQGVSFAPDATVLWNGAARPTQRLSAQRLETSISANDVRAAGPVTVQVRQAGQPDAAATLMVAPRAAALARSLQPPDDRRTVELVTTSPDSSRVAFIGGTDSDLYVTGDLYSVPVAGGRATRLTPSLAEGGVREYRYVPGSATLVYRARHADTAQLALYAVLDTGGAPVPLSAPYAASEQILSWRLSPNGQRLVYLVSADTWGHGGRAYSVPITGGTPTLLDAASEAGTGISAADPTPDSARVVITRLQDGSPQNRYTLHSAPITGGALARLDDDDRCAYGGGAVALGGGGSVVAWRAARGELGLGVCAAPSAGGPPTRVYEGRGAADLTLSADGRYAVFRSTDYTLYSVALAAPHALARLNPFNTIANAIAVFRVTPDSQRVVYTALGIGQIGHAVYSVPIGGGATLELSGPIAGSASGDERDLAVSPDGERVVFTANQDGGRNTSELWSAPTNGGAPAVRIGGSPLHRAVRSDSQLAFTPDGAALVYRTQPDDPLLASNFELYQTPTDGGGPARRISAPVPVVAGAPFPNDLPIGFALSANGATVAFRGAEGSQAPRYLYATDIATATAHIGPTGGILLSPDGRVRLRVPAGALSSPAIVTYRGQGMWQRQGGQMLLRSFALDARSDNGQPIASFAVPATLEVAYTDGALNVLRVDEASLTLSASGAALNGAVPGCASCARDAANNLASLPITQLGMFALRGTIRASDPTPTPEPSPTPGAGQKRVLLPVVRR